jgi:CubicO group peptidase (beta-lactamase class C family)
MRKLSFVVITLLISAFGFTQPKPFEKRFVLIDRYIDSLMKSWNIPGLALGIVYKDQLIFSKGYGYRDIEKRLPVESTTIFPIASNTKLFTATAACMLADEGKLHLDKSVRSYLPSLHFYNDELDANVTLRDLLSHRTGLPRYDGIWVASPFTRKELIGKVAHMKPQLRFREGYIYNNMMFSVCGAVMETVTSMSWEEIIRKKIFEPLGMNASCFTNEEMMHSQNFSYAYFEPDSSRRLEKRTFVSQSPALGPAGTIKSNVEDMSHWMIAQMNFGKYKGQQIIPETAIRQTLIPNAIADQEGRWNELSNSLYGLGRLIQMYKGYKITTHTGSIDGYHSNVTFVPSENIAVYMVHNSAPAGSLRPVMTLPVIDRLLNLSITPWSERYLEANQKARKEEKKRRDSVRATQIKNTLPSHSLNDYTGKYFSSTYGEMNIELQDGRLWLAFRGQRSLLHHFHYDQFITDEEAHGKPDFRLSFLTSSKGEINKFSVQPFGDPIAEFMKSSN